MSRVDDYLAKVPAKDRAELERIRHLVRASSADAVEVISYGIPGFKYRGKYLLGYAAFKDHLSLFPTAGPIEAFQAELTDFQLSRGTIQFTIDHPIPEPLIVAIIKYRRDDIDQSVK